MNDATLVKIARIAYEATVAATEAYGHDDLPKWENQTEELQKGFAGRVRILAENADGAVSIYVPQVIFDKVARVVIDVYL